VNTVVNLNPTAGTLAILPEILLTILAAAVILLDVFWPRSRRRDIALISAIGLGVIALVALLIQPPPQGEQLVLGGMFRHDFLTQLFTILTLIGGAITCLISIDVPNIGREGEFYAVIMVATMGACIISGAADLITVFLGLETLSISLYILAGFLRNNARSSEAGMKYFLFGAFTSTIMVYGMSLLYGFTGQTNLYAIGDALRAMPFRTGDTINVASRSVPSRSTSGRPMCTRAHQRPLPPTSAWRARRRASRCYRASLSSSSRVI
jgi:NADH-quinone oxidoreductase subunit N